MSKISTRKQKEQQQLIKKIQDEYVSLQDLEKQQQEFMQKSTKLDTQKNEHNLLESEMDLLNDDCIIYKKTGPILCKMDLDEAKVEIKNKIKILKDQIKKIDNQTKNISNKIKSKRNKIQTLQMKLPKQKPQQ